MDRKINRKAIGYRAAKSIKKGHRRAGRKMNKRGGGLIAGPTINSLAEVSHTNNNWHKRGDSSTFVHIYRYTYIYARTYTHTCEFHTKSHQPRGY